VNQATEWWAYILLFLVVAASWAGVPFVGATALTGAAVAASQGHLDLAAVILVATAGGEAGGLLGYSVGNRWGRRLLERPGKHQAGRQKMVERGERAYARWGRLAVFFTPAVVSGTAKMRLAQFALWNLMAAFAFAVDRRARGGTGGGRADHRVLRAAPPTGGGPARRAGSRLNEAAPNQRGKPRMRPAMMSRWTCEVPPAMPAALLQSH
jgi:membrane protein YqaA with SNARE-associated domain